jgi:hypothetical protein
MGDAVIMENYFVKGVGLALFCTMGGFWNCLTSYLKRYKEFAITKETPENIDSSRGKRRRVIIDAAL